MITPPTSKNRVILIKNGNQFIQSTIKLIASAKHFIFLHTYIFEKDLITMPIIEELKIASQRGVHIFMLIDGVGSLGFPKETLSELAELGIKIKVFKPIIQLKNIGRRLHQKVLLIDNKISVVGGINFSQRFNHPEQPWLDYACCLEGEESFNVYQKVLPLYLKNFKEHKELLLSLGELRHYSSQMTLVKTNENDFMKKKQEIYRSYIRAIAHAQKEITIMATYFIPGKKVLKELKKASRHGVKVRLIFGSITDHSWAQIASRNLYYWYLQNHIEIYEWDNSIIHGKLALIDHNWVSIGSYNHNFISRYRNLELNFEIINQNFAEVINKEFQRIILRSKKIELEHLDFSLKNVIASTLVYILLNIITFFSTIFLIKEDEYKENILK